ncbi:MAG: phosphopantetheine-binding protein [Gammaproteobacteria bacterium]|nr:phosphopantetheine-binding protein [Gammaproteobacteria bacterium]
MNKEIQQQVMNVVNEVLTLEPRDDLLDASFGDDLSLSSLERMTLFIALEDEFGHDISQDEVEDIDTLRGVIQFVELKVGQ